MRYRTFIWILCFCLMFTGCSGTAQNRDGASEYPQAYVQMDERRAQSMAPNLNWSGILNSIPYDEYVAYPGLHATPLKATLYKNGRITELELDDPRLIRLMNFYHNMVYNGVYSYTQGSFSPGSYYELESNAFKLELEYTPDWESGSLETTFDKMLIVESAFVGVRSDTPFGNYSFSSFGRYPLYTQNMNWLEIFGF